MVAQAAADGDDLAQKVQDLPPELFDETCELVFTPDDAVVEINKNYKTSLQLHVDHKSREAFAERYYRDTAFAVEVSLPSGRIIAAICSWWQMLPGDHRLAIRQIRWPRLREQSGDTSPLWIGFALAVILDECNALGVKFLDLRPSLCTNVMARRQDGSHQEVWVTVPDLQKCPAGATEVELKYLENG